MRLLSSCAPLLLAACMVDDPVAPETSVTEQHGIQTQGIQTQGIQTQGIQTQGIQTQGIQTQGFSLSNATLGSHDLDNLRVVKGELFAERDGQTLRGTQLAGTQLVMEVSDGTNVASLPFRIASITAEVGYDPTWTGNTFLYNVEQLVDGSWQAACGYDHDGRRAAIPFAETWNATGDRVATPGMFTFGCTTGVLAKCYRWGYKPWLTGYGGNMADVHQTCTRLARADYCGDGGANTHEGTLINVWDRLPAPGPIQKHGLLPPFGMLFEAGWGPDGAVCLSRARWLVDDLLDGGSLANLCPDRLIPPGLLGATVCDTVGAVLDIDAGALMFNESYLNLL